MILVIVLQVKSQPPPGLAGAMHSAENRLVATPSDKTALAATDLKIGSQFISAAIERPSDREKLSKILDLPSWHEVISLLRIGYLEKHNANETTTHSFKSVRRKANT